MNQSQEKNMLTEVDIERIMAAKRHLAESIADESEFEFTEEDNEIQVFEEDTPVTETNGLM